MVVRIIYDGGEHSNFYEGSHVGLHCRSASNRPPSPENVVWTDGLDVVVESEKGSVTIEVDKGSNTQIYLMNNQGRTIDKRIV